MTKITNTISNLESAVLGAIISCKGAIFKVVGDLDPLYFTTPFTQTVCQQLLDMYNENMHIDLTTVGSYLPAMASVMGIEQNDLHYRLVGLLEGVYSDAHIETHMLQLKEQYVKSELANTLMEGIKSLKQDNSVSVIAELQDKTVKLLEHKATAFQLDHDAFIKQITANSENKDNVINLTGIEGVDKTMQGTTENEFMCVAGIAGSGKSSLINTSLKHLIEQEVGFYFWSGEMTILQTKSRLIAALSNIPAWRIEKKFTKLSTDLRDKVLFWSKKINDLERNGSIVFREGKMSVNQFQGEVLQARFKNENIKVAFADAMRLFTEVLEAKDEEQAMGKVCRSLRSFCNTRKMRVVMVAQLVKAGRSNADYVPKVAHIRGKGTDQEFTKVLLVHRPYLTNMTEQNIPQEQTQLIIGKNNHGATGVIEADFDCEHMLFKDFYGEQLKQDVFGSDVDISKFALPESSDDNEIEDNQIEVPF